MKATVMALLLAGSMAPALPADEPERVPLRVEIGITHYRGSETLGRRSHVLYVLANRSVATELRYGREVPVSDQYRNVGTNITCRAESLGDRFVLRINFEQSSLAASSGPPWFHTFNVGNHVLIADGQTVELAHASTPGSDESWRLDVTLAVLR